MVDLKQPDGADTVLALAERADALIEGYRPGVAERLGHRARTSAWPAIRGWSTAG